MKPLVVKAAPQFNEQVTEQLVLDFFRANPNPDDPDIHELAGRLGMEPEILEKVIYRVFTKFVQSCGNPSSASMESASNGEFEKAVLRFLERNLFSAIDSDVVAEFLTYNAATQLDTMLSYVSKPSDYEKGMKQESQEIKNALPEFLKSKAPAQFKTLMPFFKRIT